MVLEPTAVLDVMLYNILPCISWGTSSSFQQKTLLLECIESIVIECSETEVIKHLQRHPTKNVSAICKSFLLVLIKNWSGFTRWISLVIWNQPTVHHSYHPSVSGHPESCEDCIIWCNRIGVKTVVVGWKLQFTNLLLAAINPVHFHALLFWRSGWPFRENGLN